MHDTKSSASTPSTMQASHPAISQDSSSFASNTTCQVNYLWPSDTEIVIFPETNKVLLTIQTPLMCLIFQDAFKNLWASLLFIHAFLDPSLTCSMITEALSVAAKSYLPRAANIRNQLKLDDKYIANMCHLVSPSLVTCFINLHWLTHLAA